MRKFVEHFVRRVSSLSHEEQQLVLSAFAEVSDAQKVREIIEEEQETERLCPHCQSKFVYKHGKANGLQRYRCRQCKRTYNGLTKTPLANLRYKDKWLRHIKLMNDSTVLRETAAELEISLDTAFHWRHKFCQWMRAEQEFELSGIIEIAETYFNQSNKGQRRLDRPAKKRGDASKNSETPSDRVCVFAARDRANNSLESVMGADPNDWLDRNLTHHMATDSILVTDELSSYKALSSPTDINQVNIRHTRDTHPKGAFHIQHVSSYHGRLTNRINRHFKGVATKYLPDYLNWQHVIEDEAFTKPGQILRCAVQANQHFP